MTAGVIDTVAEVSAPPPRSRRRLWVTLAIAVVLVISGVITSVAIGLRYAHAAALQCACGLSWGAGERGHTVKAGPYTAMIVTARPGHAQSFYVMLMNTSPVTQTILGLQYPGTDTAEPSDLAIALPGTSTLDDQAEFTTRQFSSKPASIPPQGIRWIRYTIHTSPASVWGTDGSREEYVTDLYLRVRVGWFTRNEKVHLEDTAFVLQAPRR